jgi:putative MATE family efflux protein
MSSNNNLTDGALVPLMAKLSTPMVLGIIAVMSISLADTYFVSMLGTKPLAALSFTFPVTFTIASLAIGLSAGAASVVSRALGSNDKSRAKRLSTDSLLLSFVIVFIISTIGLFTIEPLFTLMGASGITLDFIVRYMTIWYFSMPFLIVPMVSNGLIRATGDTFWPSIIMIFSAVINVGLTPLFIFGWQFIPAMDIEGAAIATLIARATTFFFALWIIIFREQLVSLALDSMDVVVKSWKEISKIALPSAAGNMTNPIAIGVVTSLLAAYGDDAVAAFGVATRIESFLVIPMLAMSAAISPLVGQNWGAKQFKRVRKIQVIAYSGCVIWGVIASITMIFASEHIAMLFDIDQATVEIVVQYLTIVSLSLFGYGISICGAACFNAAGKPLIGLFNYAVRSIFFYIPLCYGASILFEGVGVIFCAIAVANILSGLLLAAYTFYRLDKK